jgi:hypothetical protein
MRSMNAGNGETVAGPCLTWKDPEMIILRESQSHWWRLL